MKRGFVGLFRFRESSTCGAKPWAMPDVKLSPKNLSEADRQFVLEEVAKFGGNVPIEHALMPPSSWYLSDAFAKAEAKAVFASTWQLACRADQVCFPCFVFFFCLSSKKKKKGFKSWKLCG
jgi:hypothetical protein